MKTTKWGAIYTSAHAEERLIKNTGDFFRENLLTFLNKPNTPNGETNQPRRILKDAADKTIGTLSRIFDAFKYPVPDYETIKKIYERPDGLREYMQKMLDEILPILLNADKTALHQGIINAIGSDDYEKMKAENTEQGIARQFVNALFISFPQRVIDSTLNDPIKGNEIFSTISIEITRLANKVTLNGLPQQSELQPEVLTKTLNDFQTFLEEAKVLGINIPSAKKIVQKLDQAAEILDPNNELYVMVVGKGKLSKALAVYDEAVDLFVADTQATLDKKPMEPEEANWFKKIIRFIFRNEKLFQSSDEKRYDREVELHSKLDQLIQKLTFATAEEQLTQENEAPEQEEDHENPFTPSM